MILKSRCIVHTIRVQPKAFLPLLLLQEISAYNADDGCCWNFGKQLVHSLMLLVWQLLGDRLVLCNSYGFMNMVFVFLMWLGEDNRASWIGIITGWGMRVDVWAILTWADACTDGWLGQRVLDAPSCSRVYRDWHLLLHWVSTHLSNICLFCANLLDREFTCVLIDP